MQDLTITIVQTALHWEDKEANMASLEKHFDTIGQTDLIIIPETFNAGFTMNAANVAETMDGNTVAWLRDQAAKRDAVITGSMVIEEHGNYYNRMIWMRPDGTHAHYDKRHLFSMADEDQHFTGGNDRVFVELNGWRVFLQVCYDLRFPVWSRVLGECDLMIYVANWPEPRKNAWSTLLQARAIENQCYVAGVNRIGEDGNGFKYAGDSVVIEPKGTVISNTEPYVECVETVTLNWNDLAEYREKFPLADDADSFTVG